MIHAEFPRYAGSAAADCPGPSRPIQQIGTRGPDVDVGSFASGSVWPHGPPPSTSQLSTKTLGLQLGERHGLHVVNPQGGPSQHGQGLHAENLTSPADIAESIRIGAARMVVAEYESNRPGSYQASGVRNNLSSPDAFYFSPGRAPETGVASTAWQSAVNSATHVPISPARRPKGGAGPIGCPNLVTAGMCPADSIAIPGLPGTAAPPQWAAPAEPVFSARVLASAAPAEPGFPTRVLQPAVPSEPVTCPPPASDSRWNWQH